MILCKKYILVFCFIIGVFEGIAQSQQRPFIWVKQEDKASILNKMETQAWAKSFYKEFKQRVDKDIIAYKKSPEDFLNKIPFDWSKQKAGSTPPLKRFEDSVEENNTDRSLQNKYLQIGVDCGVLYFLTDDKSYAQCAVDILNAFVEGLIQIQPSTEKGNGGWLYPTDHLREARIIGAQLPIIYDFVATYIDNNKKAFSIGSKQNTNFSVENAQKVFLTYAQLAVEHGHAGSNWSVLESFSLVQNALALNDENLRKKYLDFYLVKGTEQQDALPDVAHKYKNEGDVYPETSQYSNGVAEFTTRMLILLDRYNPDLKLGQKYYKIPFSLDRWNSIRYPNGEIIRFGDGHRHFEAPYDAYDMGYLLGKNEGITQLVQKFGPLVAEGIQSNNYDRAKVGKRSGGISPYFTPLQLLWLEDIKENYDVNQTTLSRTDQFSHAGVFLQRNLSATKNPEDGLMCFVGGGQMVHGHANGMDMELYGLGEVLGVDNGRGAYRTDLHENYSRLFAAHNTVIVNGASQGEGDWVNLGINKTELMGMEPKPLQKALSPNYSFTRTNFLDDKGNKAEATQERTLALIRTSPTTGYYMDVFRSKSALPNEYHDYLYHNIGDDLLFLNKDMNLKADENRFQENAKGDYVYNKKYRNPGWHFFKNVISSDVYTSNVKATFEINKLQDKKNRNMNVFIIGNKDREYTKVKGPLTFEAPKPYDKLPTPTLVIRQKGEAWTNPFAVLYEPTFNKNAKNGIQSVSKLESNGVFKGFAVVSTIDKKEITQIIINQEANEVYENKKMGIYFKGSFAIITLNQDKKVENIYIGEGFNLKYNKINIQSKDVKSISAYLDFSSKEYQWNASDNTKIEVVN
ncbi:heparinase II/III family protein [Flavobacterium sp. NG2]|uniref:heparinase II/III domain-containing protein n=1 Tax=Flavobacterium sp. NG2 TaxID=3097547 RepID=UPI002A7F26C5|nr:heparinase II/III family protein [Flavobacterium sp. NG2]WPR70111.1 heparinase II/III family protein [Flavobacterium sp. NG2]